jgi:hypothetical protein
MKLGLINKHVEERNLARFPSCKCLRNIWRRFAWPKEKFSEIIQLLQNEFSSRFNDFHSNSNGILYLQNPFKVAITDVGELEMEVTELD